MEWVVTGEDAGLILSHKYHPSCFAPLELH